MIANTVPPKSRTSGCGCGSSSAAISPCTCGSAECLTCLDPGYTRPKFFAGQLLTEDDLQLLGDYVVGKNRLHNRYLMGSGVVCGLDVTCQPCGGGHVIVNPGYAIDCCGNDIVLTCPQDLDINKMAHDLQVKLKGGYDCGDPCIETSTSAGQGYTTASNKNGNNKKNGTSGTTDKPASHIHKYCLYVNYCEQETEPVSPYATDEPCGPGVCEPTRIREGFRFELRCPEASEPGPALCSRFWDCVGDLPSYEKTVADRAVLDKSIPELRTALAEMRTTPMPEIPPGFSAKVTEHITSLNTAIAKFNEPSTDKKETGFFEPLLDATVTLASDVAFYIVGRKKTVEAGDDAGKVVEAATLIIKTCKQFSPSVDTVFPPNTLGNAYANAVFEVSSKAAGALPSRREGAEHETTVTPDLTLNLLARSTVIHTPLLNSYANSLDAIRDWIIKHLEQAQQIHCDLLCKVEAAPLPTGTATMLHTSGLDVVTRSGGILLCAVEEILRGCLCNALNPPCSPCEDRGVLLACLTVVDCKVKDICNLERDFVLSPTAIRYWIPEIQRIGEAIEKWCCPCPCPDDDAGASVTTESNTSSFLVAARAPGYTGWLGRLIEYGCPRPGVTKGRTIDAFANMAPRMAEALRGIAAPGFGYAADTTMTNMEEKLASISSALESLQREHEKLRAKVDRKKNPEV